MLQRNLLPLVAATAALAPAADAVADGAATARPATPATIDVDLPGPHDSVRAKLNAAVRPPLVRDVVDLARVRARLHDHRLHDHRLRRGVRHRLSTWSPSRLRHERRDLKLEIRRLRAERRRERLAARRAARRAAAAHEAAAAARLAATTQQAAATQQATSAASPTTSAAPSSGSGSATPGNLQSIAACESGGNPAAVDASGTYRGKYQFDMQTWQSVGGSGDPAAAPEAEQDRRAAMLYARSGSSPWPVCGR